LNLTLDVNKGRKLAPLLYDAFTTKGIHGRTDMPEDVPPIGVAKGSLEHILFLTLTVSIDYQRDAPALWHSARNSYADPETRYLFNPNELYGVPSSKVINDMQKHGLSKKPRNDAFIWRTVALSFLKKWNGDPRNFLEDCNWDGPTILKRLKTDQHPFKDRFTHDFPFLRGDKIGPLWIRMLRDNAGINEFQNLDKIPIPVDIHVARATLALGLVRGEFNGPIGEIFGEIRQVWFESVRGLQIHNRLMIALDVDESLWHLSKYGCSRRDSFTGDCPMKHTCEAAEYCVSGKIRVLKNTIELKT
jgi:hypothetical protein